MKKRISILIVVLFLMAGVVYEFMHLRKEEVPVNTAITAIPIDASFVFESRKNYPLWKGISKTNLIWKDMLATDWVNDLNSNIQYLDTLMSGDPRVHSIAEVEPIFISAHKNGQEHFDYLFICSMPNAADEAALDIYMQKLGQKGSITQSQYDGICTG